MRSTDLHGYELPEGIRAIARCGAGVNNIPVEEYAKKGVVVFNSPGANSNAVKELVLGMLVLSSRGVVQSMNWVRDNADDPEIQVDAEKAKKAFVGRELKGKRIGVIGLGNVGSKVANACVDLGMDVYGYDPFISVEHAWVLSREVQRVGTLEDLCRGCDYLTVHVPSKADTIGMISTQQIDLLAPDACSSTTRERPSSTKTPSTPPCARASSAGLAATSPRPRRSRCPIRLSPRIRAPAPVRLKPTAQTWPSASSRITWRTATSHIASTTPPAAWARRAPQAASPACTPTCPT